MADSHSKRRSHRNEGNEFRSNKTIKYKARHHHHESKTPPLTQKNPISINKLIKERETLKRKLEKMERDIKGSGSSKHTLRKHEEKKDFHHVKKKKVTKEPSPEQYGDYAQLDSEDEEAIIEKRRIERKRLLEKLNDKKNETKIKNETSHEDTECIENKNDSHSNRQFCLHEYRQNLSMTDMFAETDEFTSLKEQVTQDNSNNNSKLADNWDDSEGYYNITVGDQINGERYIIKSTLGQGVFANVVRAGDKSRKNTEVAIKIIRNNDLMYRCGLKEISMLKKINDADPDGKYHCVKMLNHFMHKGHLCIVLEPLHLDLRCVIKRYGKNHGLNVKALMSYSRQLLLALRILKKTGIIHADVKPDNILVNEKKNVLKLCDFGSATKEIDNEPTPYLVSRFYRAPEIVLGIPFSHEVDLWATACTMYEMATAKIMFPGSSNNKMLKSFMDLKGKISSKLLKKGKFKDQHFNYNNHFLVHKKDEVTEREKVVEVSNIVSTRDLQKELKRHFKAPSPEEHKKIDQLRDLLEKMLMLDPNQRISIVDSLKHPFIQEQLPK